MAFQAGTRVDPRLMQADYSGFARAAEIQAQSMANLGEQIGNAVTKYAVNKQKKEDKKLRYESILPYTTSMFGAEEGEKMAQTFSSDPKLGAQILEFAGMQKDQRALQQAYAVSTTPEGVIDYSLFVPAYAQLGGRDVAGVSKLVDERTSAAKPVTGKLVTMEELNQLRDEGYKPKVEFGAKGEMIMTDMSTFAPDDGGTVPLTPGQEKMLEATAADLAPWGTGGKQQAEANLATYDKLLVGLTSGEINTRTIADFAPSALGIDDTIRGLFNPTGQNALDNVRRVIFQGLKDTLGGNFAEAEAQRLVSASYNPALPEEMNIQRLQDARDVLSDTIAAKNDLYAHIAAGGTMADYEGVTPAAVLSSGTAEIEAKYANDQDKGGFQAPSGLTIRERKSNRPTK